MLEVLIVGILLLYVLMHLLYILHFLLKVEAPEAASSPVPVTIIVAARNEEKHLPAFLSSWLEQDYPKEYMQVIIGNDQSEDKTLSILKEWEAKYSEIKVVNIEKRVGHLRGKQNVLAQLIPLASTEYILMTDADIRLPASWVRTMVAYLKRYTFISAPTIVQGSTLFHHLQGLDWLFSISVIKPFSDWGMPITAVGNNIGFRKSAYSAIGGYESLPFSLTEDYALFQKIVLEQRKPFKWLHFPEVLNLSHPVEDLKTFLHQRKRWYEGAKKGPWYAILIFVHHITIYPALIAGFYFFSFPFATALWFIKWLTDWIWLWTASRALKQQKLLKYFLPFQLYFMVLTFGLPIYFWTSRKVLWKGRIYQ